jgi:hypothetical protein
MIAILILAQLAQTPAIAPPKPVLVNPGIRTLTSVQRKQKMQADARYLLGRAEAVQAEYSPAAGQPTKAELDSQIGQLKNDLDSMSAMGEMESLRLQMAMDRMAKMMSTLSNLLKKVSDTQQSIVQNIK